MCDPAAFGLISRQHGGNEKKPDFTSDCFATTSENDGLDFLSVDLGLDPLWGKYFVPSKWTAERL